MTVKIIVAADEDGLIGKGNDLPWHLPVDFKFFKETTLNKVVIMGSNTFYSLNGILPNRKNVVISRTRKIDGVENYNNIEEAIKNNPDCFIIGGAQIYSYALSHNIVDEIYLTRIHERFGEGDAYFKYDKEKWIEIDSRFYKSDEKNKYDHTYLRLKKAP